MRPLGCYVTACALALGIPEVLDGRPWGPSTVRAADLQDATRHEFDRYLSAATTHFLERVRTSPSSPGGGSSSRPKLADGEVVGRAGSEDGIIDVRGGLIHHWIAATFMPGVTLERVLSLSS